MSRPKMYLDSSFICHLAAPPHPHDALARQEQRVSLEWWDRGRPGYDLYVSTEVLREIKSGDQEEVKRRLRYVESLPVLQVDDQARLLTDEFNVAVNAPIGEYGTIAHAAIATANHMNFLMSVWDSFLSSWYVRTRITACTRSLELEPVAIRYPKEL